MFAADDDLTPAELAALLGTERPRQQATKLVAMGVPFRFGGGQVRVRRAVAKELPIWQDRQRDNGVRLDLVA